MTGKDSNQEFKKLASDKKQLENRVKLLESTGLNWNAF
jgi:hypothetical protein